MKRFFLVCSFLLLSAPALAPVCAAGGECFIRPIAPGSDLLELCCEDKEAGALVCTPL